MSYEPTDAEIGNLFRVLVGARTSSTFARDVRTWFATLPVVALADVGIPGQPVATDGDVDIFEAACQDEPVYFGPDTRPIAARILNAVFGARRENPAAVLAAETPESARRGPSEDWLRKAGDAEDAATGKEGNA